jgi:hypothetical protein
MNNPAKLSLGFHGEPRDIETWGERKLIVYQHAIASREIRYFEIIIKYRWHFKNLVPT